MFRGLNKVTVDAKGRFAFPTRVRERISQRCANQLVATVDRDHCLLIYPMPDWEDIERKLERLPSFNPQTRRLQRLMLGHASEMELDSHGRVLLQATLREFAGIEKHAVLVGQGRKFELWDETRWNERREDWLAEDEAGLELPAELETLSL
ncbi:MAG: division/cell wall cluster transcriptional repressor MraZ [Pseudomonadota bacterium]